MYRVMCTFVSLAMCVPAEQCVCGLNDICSLIAKYLLFSKINYLDSKCIMYNSGIIAALLHRICAEMFENSISDQNCIY